MTPQTPPIFFFHTAEDTAVPPQNSVQMFLACLKAGVPAELHVFQHGQHGVGSPLGIQPCRSGLNYAGSGCVKRVSDRTSSGCRSRSGHNEGHAHALGSISMLPESNDLPIGWSMVMRGNYSIPNTAGLIPGTYRIKIVNMGDVAPHPTTADAIRSSRRHDGRNRIRQRTANHRSGVKGANPIIPRRDSGGGRGRRSRGRGREIFHQADICCSFAWRQRVEQ